MTNKTYETKANHGGLEDGLDSLMSAFECFKTENDERLSQLEKRGCEDVVTKEKLERIETSLGDLSRKYSRPLKGETPRHSGVALQHKSAFEGYVRQGEVGNLRQLEGKALSVGSDPDGGYLVPGETEETVNSAVRDISPIRAISGVRQVSSAVYKKPFAISGPNTGWVGETAGRPETDTPNLTELNFPTMELYAMPAATSTLLDDSAVDIDSWLAEEVRAAFAEQEGTAFVVGDGVNKPTGFLSYPTVDDATWSWGNIGTISTGVTADFPAGDPGDVLIDMIYALKSSYRANAHFVMNRATQGEIRKMKDADGNYLWQPSTQPGDSPTLLGFPVAEAEDMPDIAGDSLSLAFGDFRRGYLIVDRIGLRVLRDPYSAKPYVLFYTTKRVGGGVQDFDAIKLLKFGA